MVDTCQAQSMHRHFYSPNILAVGSSKVGEDSLSVRKNIVSFHSCVSSLLRNIIFTY